MWIILEFAFDGLLTLLTWQSTDRRHEAISWWRVAAALLVTLAVVVIGCVAIFGQ